MFLTIASISKVNRRCAPLSNVSVTYRHFFANCASSAVNSFPESEPAEIAKFSALFLRHILLSPLVTLPCAQRRAQPKPRQVFTSALSARCFSYLRAATLGIQRARSLWLLTLSLYRLN